MSYMQSITVSIQLLDMSERRNSSKCRNKHRRVDWLLDGGGGRAERQASNPIERGLLWLDPSLGFGLRQTVFVSAFLPCVLLLWPLFSDVVTRLSHGKLPDIALFAVTFLIIATLFWLPYEFLIRHLQHRQVLRTTPHLCDACGYDLTGNASGVCPECGRRMDRDGEAAND